MKKCFIIGLIMAMMPNMGICAGIKSVDQLIAEKQAKMEKLKKCKGTTKNLKIAGISTLGITAVGVGANIAEAVILKDEQGKLETEKANLKTAQEKNAQLKSKQGKTDTSTKELQNYDGGCDKYVAEVYDAVQKGEKCPKYSNMNICKDNLIKNIKDDKDKDVWVKKAKEVCEKNTKKNEEKNFKSVCGDITTAKYQQKGEDESTNLCIFTSDKYLASENDAKEYIKETFSKFDGLGCNISDITKTNSGNYNITCNKTENIDNTIHIKNKDIDEEFKNKCKTVSGSDPKQNGTGAKAENTCSIIVEGDVTVADEVALKNKAKAYAKEMGDVCADAKIANYTASSDVKEEDDKARFRIVCKAGKIQNALYVMFNSVKCTTTGQTYKQDGCKN